MTDAGDGRMVKMEVFRFRDHVFSRAEQNVAREVPCTIIANDVEIATLSCTPADLREFAAGFLFTAGLIDNIGELLACDIDSARWNLACSVSRTPDIGLMNRRTYTSGCGKGVMFSNLNEFLDRSPIDSGLTVTAGQIALLSNWLQHSSPLFRETGGVHTAALAVRGDLPEWAVDDIGRHNAVDKAIGRGLLGGAHFGECALVTTGRTSSSRPAARVSRLRSPGDPPPIRPFSGPSTSISPWWDSPAARRSPYTPILKGSSLDFSRNSDIFTLN
jgi:FdhD protein